MKNTITLLLALALTPIAPSAAKPNVIFILADDPGWAEIDWIRVSDRNDRLVKKWTFQPKSKR